MGSAEMQCVVCEAAPNAGILFLRVLEELYGDLPHASVSLIREHTHPHPSIHSTGKRHPRKPLSGVFEVCVGGCSAPIL